MLGAPGRRPRLRGQRTRIYHPPVRRALSRLTTWLVLAVCVLSGVSPAQALVLCLEPDGSVTLEAAEQRGCAPCDDGEDSAMHVEELGVGCCACVDIPLPQGGTQPQVVARVAEAGLAPALPPAPLARIAEPAPVERRCSARARASAPPKLDLIRTVVLRV